MTRAGLEALTSGAILSPFTRNRQLLDGTLPGDERVIDLTIGEPRETMPDFVGAMIHDKQDLFAKYPPIRGYDELRLTIAAWIRRRYGDATEIDPDREVLPVCGSREALFFAMLPAAGRKQVDGEPVAFICNPFYTTYLGAVLAAGVKPIFLNATEASGHLPDLDWLAARPELMQRAVAFFLCSPANPQGASADRAYLLRALDLARRYNFMLFVDECYSEIYGDQPPIGGLEVACGTAQGFQNLVVFNSLSKRSNVPGLRSGFMAGDGDFMERLAEIRNMVAPQIPGPIQHVSIAAWSDEDHVISNRRAYQLKYDVCDEILGARFGYHRPQGGFFLWLNMNHIGGCEAATLTLWKGSGVKVIPGAYLSQADCAGVNPGDDYIRVALVHDLATIRLALQRIVQILA